MFKLDFARSCYNSKIAVEKVSLLAKMYFKGAYISEREEEFGFIIDSIAIYALLKNPHYVIHVAPPFSKLLL